MTSSQESSRKFSLEMKSEVHYKKAAKSYRKSKQYINMINLYPTLQNTLIECKDENLIEKIFDIFFQIKKNFFRLQHNSYLQNKIY